jgi:hypothetical protein
MEVQRIPLKKIEEDGLFNLKIRMLLTILITLKLMRRA